MHVTLIATSSSIIHNKLRLLNDCKSSGPGGWPPVALTETAVEISIPLSISYFVKSSQSGVSLHSWKTTN